MKARNTRQKRAVLAELKGAASHPTAEEVHRLARRSLPRIGLGTVYRNLESLVEAGLAVRVEAPGTPMRFDGNPTRHYHIRCVTCGRVDDIPARVKTDTDAHARGRTEYRVLACRVEFEGVCPRCRKRKA